MRAAQALRRLRFGLLLLMALATAVPAAAQLSTATVQGIVTDATGVMPGVTVTARETESGFSRDTTTDTEGRYTLAGLRPGTYEIRVTLNQYKPQARTVTALVGQTLDVSFSVRPDLAYSETVEVVSERLSDIKTSEIATNVTQEQLQYLPQNSRNFLNFAALAPGLRVADNEFRKEVTSGALPSQHTNVFIDGVSFKNDLILGGVVGQDSSRGSPFPQNAVQEFQVLTQNFKAEYEKASSAVITAITRSGSNNYRGELFSFYQDKRLVQHEGVRQVNGIFTKIDDLETVGAPKPTYERWQWGASLGGPIVRDRMQFFGSVRRKPPGSRRHRACRYRHRRTAGARRPAACVRGNLHQPIPREPAVREALVPAGPDGHAAGHLQLPS